MDRIEGDMLAHVWLSCSAGSKAKILAQLKHMMDELRSLSPPSIQISNVDGGPLYNPQFPGTSLKIGPFKTIHDFHYITICKPI